MGNICINKKKRIDNQKRITKKKKLKEIQEGIMAFVVTHKGIIAGKLKGQMPAQTPNGSLRLYVSTPFDTLGTYSPICRVAIPQACSTTSA